MNRIFAPAAVMALLAGTAQAQFVFDAHTEASQDRKVEVAKQTFIVTNDDGQKYKIVIVNDEVEAAWVDGDKVGNGRVVRDDDMIKLLGDAGEVLHVFRVSAPKAPKAPQSHFFSNDGQQAQGKVSFTATLDSDYEAPPVMLGINLSEPGDALRAQLGLGDLKAILIDGVIDGLPAAKAGLKKFDVIVSLDGSEGASSDSLGKVMSKKTAGDEMKIIVMRGGEKIKLVAKLAAYDAESLGQTTSGQMPAIIYDDDPKFPGWTEKDQEGNIKLWVERNGQFPEIDEKVIEGAVSRSREAQKKIARLQSQEMKSKIEEAMREAERRVLEFRDGQLFFREREEGLQRLDELGLLEHLDKLENRFDERMPGIQSELDARLDAMERRFEQVESELDARLESFGGRMERLANLMEHLADRLERFADREED